LDSWESAASLAWPKWLGYIEEFQTELARLFKVDAQDICPQVNVSSGLTKVLQALPRRSGKDRIILSAKDFPSTAYVCQQMQRLGYKLVWLDPDERGFVEEARYQEAFDENVQAVVICHVSYGDSQRLDLKAIADAANRHEIFSIADLAQSAGVCPLDLSKSGLCAAVGSSIKWLCGGSGAGYLYVRKDWIQNLQPIDVGWFSHSDPMEFDARSFSYSSGARRFLGGTPSVFPFAVAAKSIQLINAISIEKIAEHNLELTDKLTHAFDLHDLSWIRPAKRGGTVVLRVKRSEPAIACLVSDGIHADFRPHYGIRFSPHCYTSHIDVEKLINCIKKSLPTFQG
jgi:selenocysteine lyase/cysteine desulfurase